MSRLSSEQILSKVYHDLERGYGNAKSLYEQAKEEGAVITVEEAKNFMKKQSKKTKKYQNYNSYLVPYARTEFQIDILDMNNFKQEGQERYGLLVVDAFSGFAYIHPMENKNSEDVLKALKATFKVVGEPIEIFSDEDTTFLSVVEKYLDGLGMVQKKGTHANIVERLIRTIKNGVADRIRFTKGNWTDLYKPTLKNITIQYTHQLELNQ